MLDKEKKIKEQRTAEAVDRNYMGLDGKFGIILKVLGKPVVAQGSSNYYVTEWLDVYDVPEDYNIPTEDIDAPVSEIGKIFDGLKFGHHIELSYMKVGTIPIKKNEYETVYEPALKVIKVSYKGYLVYLEAEGELHMFLPNSEWEDLISKIYDSAKKMQVKRKSEFIAAAHEEMVEEKMSFLQKLRERWGI